MNSWVGDFVGAVLLIGTLLGLGALRLFGHPRFRVRGRLPEPPGLAAAEATLSTSLAVTAVGMLLMLVQHTGGPAWAGATGRIIAPLGFAGALVGLGLLLRARLGREGRRRGRRSRPAE